MFISSSIRGKNDDTPVYKFDLARGSENKVQLKGYCVLVTWIDPMKFFGMNRQFCVALQT